LQKVASNAYHPDWIKALHQYEPHRQHFDRDDTHVLNLLNSFLFKGPYGNHFCMVFEILGVNLLEVLKRYDYKGLPLDIVKEITRQVMMGLDFLNRVCRVIHTDLKPENVLLCLTDNEIKQIVENGQLSSK
jgi:serine/threonine-protein kinase SRPK3